MVKYSLTEALAQRSLMVKKAQDQMSRVSFVTVLPRKTDSTGEIERRITATYQSVTDLFRRRDQLSALISQANATTQMVVAGRTYTIAEAIAHKEHVKYLRDFLRKLEGDQAKAEQDRVCYEAENQRRLDAVVNQTSNTKSPDEAIKKLTEGFMALNECKKIDPLGIVNKIDTMSRDIMDFEAEVDFRLSEINSRTYIEIPDTTE